MEGAPSKPKRREIWRQTAEESAPAVYTEKAGKSGAKLRRLCCDINRSNMESAPSTPKWRENLAPNCEEKPGERLGTNVKLYKLVFKLVFIQ